MGKFLALISLLFAFASSERWSVYGHNVDIHRNSKFNLLGSARCVQNFSGNFKGSNCQSISVLSQVSVSQINKKLLIGGVNPGSLLCTQVLKAKILLARNQFGEEQSFCVFGDGTFISTSSLYFYAQKNSIKSAGSR